jgi:5-methylcytosine-specific restriction enzyme A
VNTWIFQSNPKLFNVDAYLRDFRVVLWRVPKFNDQINKGDIAYLWRADGGKRGSGGIIAHGTVIGTPIYSADQEAASYYVPPHRPTSELRSRILLDSVFLHPPRLTRDQVINDQTLRRLTIVKMAQQSIYPVEPVCAQRLADLFFDGEMTPKKWKDPT